MHGQIASVPVSAENGSSVDINRVVDFLARRWKLILTVIAASVALAVIVMLTVTPRYTSTAEILLDSSSRRNLGADVGGIIAESVMVDNQISIINSLNFLRRVVENQNLVKDPEFGVDAAKSTSWLSELKGLFSSPKSDLPLEPDASSIPPDQRLAIAKLRDALNVRRIGKTYILEISVVSIDAERSARLANAVADAFIVDQLENRFEASKRASDWLTDRLQKLRDSLRVSEDAVSKFRTDNNLLTVGAQTLNQQQLSEISAQLVQIQTEAAEKLAKYEQARKLLETGGNVATLPDVMKSTVISDLRGRLAEVSGREADLVTRYGERHPMVVNVRAERSAIDRQINGEISRVIANLKNDYEVSQSRAKAMSDNVAAVSGQSGTESALTVRLRELERDASANRVLYETFLNQSKLTSEQSQIDIQDARIITPALPSQKPSFPVSALFLGAGAVLGSVLGFGIAILLDLLNAGFNSPREVEEVTGLPVLASVEWVDLPKVGTDEGDVGVVNYLMTKPLSRFSESIRSLRAGVQMSDVDNPPHVIQVTSSSPGEGKTSLAIALAVSAASSGKRVVLIDCDLRRPSVSQQFALTDKPGLVELLAQTASSEGILHRDKASGIYVLGSGGKTQNPPDLLGSVRMQSLIEQLRQSFDFVVLDAPPIGPVVDASVLAPLVDKVLFVIRWNATAREFVRHSLERIPGDRKICGIAFNMVDLRRTPKYGRYSYYSSAYYKKYYVG